MKTTLQIVLALTLSALASPVPTRSSRSPTSRRPGAWPASLAAAGCPAGVYIRMAEAPYEMQMERGFRRGFPGAEVFLCPPNVLTYPPAREQVIAFPAGLPAGGGVFCRSRGIAAEFVVLQRDAAPGRPIRFIATVGPNEVLQGLLGPLPLRNNDEAVERGVGAGRRPAVGLNAAAPEKQGALSKTHAIATGKPNR
jgi:hypothetical protein